MCKNIVGLWTCKDIALIFNDKIFFLFFSRPYIFFLSFRFTFANPFFGCEYNYSQK